MDQNEQIEPAQEIVFWDICDHCGEYFEGGICKCMCKPISNIDWALNKIKINQR